MPRCLISFGGNLGDRGTTLCRAAAAIVAADGIREFSPSRVYATPAIGGPADQPPFLNAAASIQTTLSAASLLDLLQHIESDCGRIRTTRWSARQVDLDLVLYGDLIGQRQQLSLPHPRYTARRFVLEPAAEVAGDMIDPRFGWTIKQIADHLRQDVASAALIGGTGENRRALIERLGKEPSVQTIRSESNTSESNTSEPFDPRRRWVADFGGRWDDDAVAAAERWGITTPRVWMRLLEHPVDDLVDRQTDASPYFATPFPAQSTTQSTTQSTIQSPWPSPHQLWPGGGTFAQYDLEISDLDWAANEIVSALDSMHCDCRPVDDVRLDG